MAIWEKNGHIIEDQNGHPIECAWCPCGDMTCDDIIAQQIAVCEQAGAYYLHQTGFLYSLTDPSAEVIPSIFHWIEWEYDAGRLIYVCHLKYLDCGCEKVTLATAEFAAPPATLDLMGYAFLASSAACEGTCDTLIATLIAQAVASGWTLHGEGVLVRKTSTDYPCYRFDLNKITVMICADTGSSFIYITCDCYRSDITEKNYPLYTHLEYSGCACLDIRELILTYPDVFGVDDISFGDDTVYTYDRTQSGGSIYTYMCIEHSTSYDSWYCDYRSLYVIFDNTRIGMPTMKYMYSYVPDMSILKFDTAGDYYDGGSYPLYYEDITGGELYFEGHVQPFTSSEENLLIWPHASSINWKGLTIRWSADTGPDHGMEEYGTYWSQADAQAAVNNLNNNADYYRYKRYIASRSTQTYFFEPMASITPPDYSATAMPARMEYDQDDGMWHVYEPYYDFPNNGIIYNLNFVQTNKGFLINGQSGFRDTLDVYGFTDSLSHWTSPPSEASIIQDYRLELTRCYNPEDGYESIPCPEGTEKAIGKGDAVQTIPMYDMSFIITPDESMGGCMDAEWWKTIMEEAESSESSEE